jgi:hypothetical protein
MEWWSNGEITISNTPGNSYYYILRSMPLGSDNDEMVNLSSGREESGTILSHLM